MSEKIKIINAIMNGLVKIINAFRCKSKCTSNCNDQQLETIPEEKSI